MRIDEVIQQPGQSERIQQRAILKRMHTSCPGKIVRYDSGKRVADIQPLIRDADTYKDPPLLMDVPVWFPGGYTYNVHIGDECIVVFADSCIDAWWQTGTVSSPLTDRSHDLADAFAFVGVRSLPNVDGGKNLEDELERIEEEATSVPGMKLYILGSDGCLYFEKSDEDVYIDEEGRVVYDPASPGNVDFSLNSDGELIMEVSQ